MAQLELVACRGAVIRSLNQSRANEAWVKKIRFDLSRISNDGLIGEKDNLRSISYEFCIPATEQALTQIQAIDSTLKHSRSPGRIRCKSDQYLVIGDTHKSNWREILTNLANLDDVQRIDEFVGE